MSVEELCQVCEAAPASHTCDNCGRRVCDDHYDRGAGVCSLCAGGETGAGDVGPGPTR